MKLGSFLKYVYFTIIWSAGTSGYTNFIICLFLQNFRDKI